MDPVLRQRVIEHMNEDHADAVLLYVRALGGIDDATEARMATIDLEAMVLEYRSAARTGTVQVDFDPPLAGFEEVRPRLVALVADARQRIRSREDPNIPGAY